MLDRNYPSYSRPTQFTMQFTDDETDSGTGLKMKEAAN
jgi:hypothetical protein